MHELIGHKVQRLVTVIEQEIENERERLLENLADVDRYPFTSWTEQLAQSALAKLDRSVTKYKLDLSNAPDYQSNLEHLRSHIVAKVGITELALRRHRQKQKEAEAERVREEILNKMKKAKRKAHEKYWQ
jgi:hypothetical protein